jgi:GntR family transcriptional regulator
VGDVAVERGAPLPARAAAALCLEGGAGTTISRTLLMDGELFAYAVDAMPEAVGALLSMEDLRHPSLLHVLAARGVPVARARQAIRAEVADTLVCRHLRVDFGTPVLSAERTLVDADGVPVAHARTWYRGDVYEYMVTLDIGVGAPDTIDSKLA